jgi:acyl phosphate:glycerol-3-phosphate acyltransferase
LIKQQSFIFKTMSIPLLILALISAYFLGSIPSAVWIGKKFHRIDVREHGSGNAGATNVIRVLGWKTGIPVMIIDLGKGWLAAMLPVFFNLAEPESASQTNLQIIAGIAAIIGHIYPILAGFRGGKGVATIFGVLLAIQPLLTLSCIGVFLAVLLITGIVSVSSMCAGIAFPFFLFFIFETPSVLFRIFSILVAFALIFTHRKNIGRLLKGEEPRFIKFKSKKNNS